MAEVNYERRGAASVITIDRPERRNAVDPDTADQLLEAYRSFEADDDARVMILTGAGDQAFCAGADLKSVAAAMNDEGIAQQWLKPRPDGPLGFTRITPTKPTIAAISGYALAGGFELALWCDLRVMEEDAYFGVYCRRWGIPLIDGGTVRLPRLVGQGRALDIILTGRKVTAEEAYRIGLAERIAPKHRCREVAEALAHEIARFPQACVRADRRSVYRAHGLPVAEALRSEWQTSVHVLEEEGVAGAARFSSGKGRGGDFGAI